MSHLRTVTIVLEYNYPEVDLDRPKPGGGTVWIFSGDGRNQVEKRADLGSTPGWVKLIGPIDYETAGAVGDALKRFLLENGVNVLSLAVTD